MPDHAPAPAGRRIALIAHDNKKRDMLEWAEYNLDLLAGHELFATATTGHLSGHLTMRTGRSVRWITLCAVLPRIKPAKSLRPREPITMTSASCSIASSTISRAA
jgi:hypothetical protein